MFKNFLQVSLIDLIKMFRAATGAGLRESKLACEQFITVARLENGDAYVMSVADMQGFMRFIGKFTFKQWEFSELDGKLCIVPTTFRPVSNDDMAVVIRGY